MLKRFSSVGFALLLVAAALPAFAQTSGSLRVSVSDTSGAVLPGATVVLTEEARKFTRQVVTDAKGLGFFSTVERGAYTLQVELAGFKTHVEKGVRISSFEARGVDVTLQVGGQSEKIEVVAQREIVQTQTGAREGLLTGEQIDNLSIIGRSPLELLRILPGVSTPENAGLEEVGAGNGAQANERLGINGMRGQNLVIAMDGSKLLDIGANNGTIVMPVTDFVSEVKIQTSNYAAEFGAGAAQVTAITKGGSSEFHGSIYDYVRHYKLSAEDRSRTITSPGAEKIQNKFQYPGFTLSGPLLLPGTGFNKNRDKAFFFFGLELTRQKLDAGASLAVVPTAAQRAGIFNTLAGQNLNQSSNPVLIPRGFPGAGTPAPGGDLTPYTDPMGKALLGLYPEPNYSDANNRYNYVFSAQRPHDRNAMVLRVDYNVSDSTKAYVRLARDKDTSQNPRGVWWGPSSYELPSPLDGVNLGRSAALNVTSVLSPTTTNEFVFSYSKLKLDNERADDSAMRLSTYGLDSYHGFFGNQSPYIPKVFAWNLGNLWDVNDAANIFAYNASMGLSNNFTKVLNTHAIKMGIDIERGTKRQNFQGPGNGGGTTGVEVSNGNPDGTGNEWGDLFTGRLNTVYSGTVSAVGDFVWWNADVFLQDSWKVRKNITLEYGLRVGKWSNNRETTPLGAVFLPELYNPNVGVFRDAQQHVNGVGYAALGEVPDRLIDSRPIFWMPRANFAWDIGGKGETILRGGGGIFYNRPMGNTEYNIINLAPNALDATIGHNDVPGILNFAAVPTIDGYARATPPGSITTVNPFSINYPTTYSTSLSLARRIPGQQVLEVGYVGTFGRHLTAFRQQNVVPSGRLLSGTIGNADLSDAAQRIAVANQSNLINSLRPFPTLGGVAYSEFSGTSNYHALQATLSRQTGKRLQYFVNYTWSKAEGSLGTAQNTQYDPFDPQQRSYGILGYDRTHILNLSYNLQLGDPVQSGWLGKAFLNGWQFSGISTFASGVPLRIGFNQGDISSEATRAAWYGSPHYYQGDGEGTYAITPLYTCDPVTGNKKNGEKLLDVNCLQVPGLGQTGPFTSDYNLRSPSRMNHDITIFKNFPIGKGDKKVQFRAGIFNVFNMAYPTAENYRSGDIDLNLNADCNVKRDNVPNGTGGTSNGVCDPAGGYSFTSGTQQNFGNINLLRGKRIIELALKLYF